MNGQFQVDRGSCATTPEGFEAIPAFEPNRPRRAWQFVDEFQQLLGEDSEPDVRFFMDSWTSGTTAAVESFQQRRKCQPERERPRLTSYEADSFQSQSFVQEQTLRADFVSSCPPPANGGSTKAGWLQPPVEEPAEQAQEQAWRQFAEECGAASSAIHPVTLERARLLLGVTATSTRKQIKAAYRQMVSHWHPDRFELQTEEARQLANERMAAINEAYHLLLSDLR